MPVVHDRVPEFEGHGFPGSGVELANVRRNCELAIFGVSEPELVRGHRVRQVETAESLSLVARRKSDALGKRSAVVVDRQHTPLAPRIGLTNLPAPILRLELQAGALLGNSLRRHLLYGTLCEFLRCVRSLLRSRGRSLRGIGLAVRRLGRNLRRVRRGLGLHGLLMSLVYFLLKAASGFFKLCNAGFQPVGCGLSCLRLAVRSLGSGLRGVGLGLGGVGRGLRGVRSALPSAVSAAACAASALVSAVSAVVCAVSAVS